MDLLSLPFVLMVITTTSTSDPVRLQPPPPPPTPQPAVTHGTLDKATVRHYIRLHLPAIRFCYVQELGQHHKLTQKVAVRFTIEPTGHVTGCSAGGVTSLERCVARAVLQLRFPAVYNVLQSGQQVLSSHRTAVTYRFNFKPARRARPGAAPLPPPSRSPAAAPQRSGPRLPPSATSPRPMASPTAPTSARSASSGPPSASLPARPASASQPAARPASASQPARPGPPGGAPRKPRIEARPSDDPLGGLDLSRRR